MISSSSKRINIKIEKTDKFTRNILSVNFIQPLKAETASLNAVLSGIMRLGCKKYKTQDQISLFLEKQYGASFSSYVQRIGGYQVVRFAVTFIRDGFVLNGENLEKNMLDFLYEVLGRPLLENGNFREDLFLTERQNLINRIKAKINEKRRYALDRCVEETHKGEAFGVSPDGEISVLDKMSVSELLPAYKNLFSSSGILINCAGDFNESAVADFSESFSEKTLKYRRTTISKCRKSPRFLKGL